MRRQKRIVPHIRQLAHLHPLIPLPYPLHILRELDALVAEDFAAAHGDPNGRLRRERVVRGRDVRVGQRQPVAVQGRVVGAPSPGEEGRGDVVRGGVGVRGVFGGRDGEVEPGTPEQRRARRATACRSSSSRGIEQVGVVANVAQEAEGEVPARRVPREHDARGGHAELEDEVEVRAHGVLQRGGEARPGGRAEAVFDEEHHAAGSSHQRLGRNRTVRVAGIREHEAAAVEMQNDHLTPIGLAAILPRIPRPARRGWFDLRVQKRTPAVELARGRHDGRPALLLRPGLQHGLREGELDGGCELEPGAEEGVGEALAEGVAGVGTQGAEGEVGEEEGELDNEAEDGEEGPEGSAGFCG